MKIKAPPLPGVYIFRSQTNKPLYVGKAVNLKNRIASYFHKDLTLGPKTSLLVSKIEKIEHIVTETELEALLLEAELIKRLKPIYNIRLTDDKAYKYIQITNYKLQITNSRWPTVTTSRRTDDSNSLYFGPFPEGRTVSHVLRTLRKIFPWCKYSNPPQDQKPCFYYHLGLCPGICIGKITHIQYRQNIYNVVRFLNGRKKNIISDLEKRMKKAAAQKDFEQAVCFRDQIQKLHYITQKFREPRAFIEKPDLVEDQRREELTNLIGVITAGTTYGRVPPIRIESYDISNLQGKIAVGALVVFTNGLPDRQEYRRFRIKFKNTPDDLAMLTEVLRRRLKHPEWKKPDLILIDGGLAQVRTAVRILQEYNLNIPTVALAKKLEELWFASGKRLIIPKDSPGLKLLQRIRDETHRFAITYHRRLRQQSFIDRI